MSGVATVLLVLALLVAVGDWLAMAAGDIRLGLLCRPLMMLLLIGAAVELNPQNSDAWTWFLIALSLSLLGDLVLLLWPESFGLGLGFFVAAHLAYVGGMLFLGVNGWRLVIGVGLVAIAVLAVGRLILGAVEKSQPGLVSPVRAYIGAASGMVAAAFAVGRPVGMLGAGLFYAADAMGGWNRFVQARPALPLMTTVAYQLGQVGLVLSLL